jgi:hypothetical protein
VAVVGMPVGVAGVAAVVVAVGVALRMSVGMVGVEVPACGRRGAGGADASLTERPRTVLASFGAGAAPASDACATTTSSVKPTLSYAISFRGWRPGFSESRRNAARTPSGSALPLAVTEFAASHPPTTLA